ncbi:hypothetical protein JSE7799_03403 [Jannaschia seosinensis]|uniref:Uncharacterized protein n=1 Tax=Jannaschia seosinensis TaxID=313367 RepID=A0A0M7BF14_9RHOB|nr:hypothetical protein [Jannaschia seosinensis]CUH40668.1 hypothetical protein JSE7799_03403 [Jannaschia seosinensis]
MTYQDHAGNQARHGAQPPLRRDVTNAEKARALIALLGDSSDGTRASDIPPERLRAWARDLVQAVESRRPAATERVRAALEPLLLTPQMTGAKPEDEEASSVAPADKATQEVPRLFSRPAPALSSDPETRNVLCEALEIVNPRHRPRPEIVLLPEKDAASTAAPRGDTDKGQARSAAAGAAGGTAEVRAKGEPHNRPENAAGSARLHPDAAHDPAPASKPAPARSPRRLTPAQARTRALIRANVDQDHMMREHPAVIAVALLGRSSMDQAQALRTMQGRQVRAVHRILRDLDEPEAISA